MAEAARPGATVSAPCDLAQLTTPTYARGRLAKLRREAGRKGSGRCEMARACCASHEPDQRGCHRLAIQAPWLALPRLQFGGVGWRCGLLSVQRALCTDASRAAPAWPMNTRRGAGRASPSPASPHPRALTLQLSTDQALSFRTFERDAKRAVDAVAAKVRTFSP